MASCLRQCRVESDWLVARVRQNDPVDHGCTCNAILPERHGPMLLPCNPLTVYICLGLDIHFFNERKNHDAAA
jgi:hypothetical protein